MRVHFQANAVIIQEEGEVVIVAFTDDAIQPTEVFMLQYALFEEAGQPIYCERNDQYQGCYDGIKRAELERGNFRIVFNEEGIGRLGCDKLDVSFKVDEAHFARLQVALHLMLGHSGVLVDRA